MEKNKELKDKIERLKREKDAVILAHYYVPGEIQEIADYVGDSYYLSKIATEVPQQTICFAGVSFMGESAKILSPEKTIIMPDADADCPMAHLASPEGIVEVRKEYDDVAVVCYINSTAELKEYSDVCVTSANALKIVRALPNKNIYFIPDENLGRYIASKVPEKNFIFNDGYCHVHTAIKKEQVEAFKLQHPKALVLVHPECTMDVLELADYIGSTSGIITYATESKEKEFLICTESGVLYQLEEKNPDKIFYLVDKNKDCPNMKKNTLEKVAKCLETMSPTVEITEEKRLKSKQPLIRMLELAK